MKKTFIAGAGVAVVIGWFAAPVLVHADTTLDAVSSLSSPTTQDSFHWDHTVGNGSDGLLIVPIAVIESSVSGPAEPVQSVTYGSTSLAEATTEASAGVISEIWYLKNPPAGTQTVTVTLNSGLAIDGAMGGAESFFGVDQSNPFDGTNETVNSAQSVSLNFLTTNNNEYLVDSLAAFTTGASGFTTANSNQVQLFQGSGSLSGEGFASSYQPVASSSSVTIGWNLSNAAFGNPNVLTAVAIKTTPAAITTSTPTSTPILGTDASLSDLSVNGTSIDGFSSSTLSYSVVLPSGTTTTPVVAAITTDPNATDTITQPTSTAGTATIMAIAQDATTTQTYTVNFSVTPMPPVLTTITVSPTSSIITTTDTQQFTASGFDQYGGTASTSITWSSSDDSIAMIDSSTGLATGAASGTVLITATDGSVVGTSTLTVFAAPVTLPTSTPTSTPTSSPPAPTSTLLMVSLSPASLTDATVGSAYNATIIASDTVASDTFAWTIASDTLPSDFTIATSTSSVTITGTPSAAGTYELILTATDDADATASSTQSYMLIINAAPNTQQTSNDNSGGTMVSVGSGGGGGYYNPYIPPTTGTSSNGTSTGVVLGASTTNSEALLMSLTQQVQTLEKELVTIEFKQNNCSFVFMKNLSKGMTAIDVKNLQTVMNYTPLTHIAQNGSGAPGFETTYFGDATAKAVIIFQNLFADEILVPAGLTSGNGYVGADTRAELNRLCSQD